MELGNGYSITVKSTGEIVTDINANHLMNIVTDDTIKQVLRAFYSAVRKTPASDRSNVFDAWKETDPEFAKVLSTVVATAEEGAEIITSEQILERGIDKLMGFFTEFNFEPNFRFVNTLSHYLKTSKKEAVGYINRYFELINSPYANAVAEKTKSREFTDLLNDLMAIKPSKAVNKRFKIYYGSQGTGKTTTALTEANGKCIVCHSAMLPSDLMEDFKFNEGKAEFVPSELYRAMVNGETIVLDEINLLPFESLRFLQGILDGKESLIYKGIEVKINSGFQIIGTMNLTVNGMTYGLPEPLIDRCSETRKFNLTAKNLMSAVM